MKHLRIIAIFLVMLLILTACGTRRTCSRCGETFRGDAYRGIDESTVLRRECAEYYWIPFTNIDHLRIR